LDLVVCQVRHDRNLAAADAGRILAIREDLGDEYPVMEEQAQQEIGLVVGSGGVSALPPGEQRGWRLASSDRAWTIALLPDFFALECTGYTSWSEFKRRLAALTEAVCAHIQPTVELRLGLRYVDTIKKPDMARPQEWAGFIDERLLGPILHSDLGDSVEAAQQLLQMVGPEGSQILLRHGTQVDENGNWPYTVDTDCFRTGSRRLEASGLLAGADSLHKLSLQVFQAVITSELHSLLSEEGDGS
jgi:uncharacterized protein (TIGR04255 family)